MVVALTKIDRVQAGDQAYWLEILRNGAGRYFATRLHEPDTKSRALKWEEDRAEEMKIFKNQPWCQLPDKRCLGSQMLTRSLSKRLAELIKKRYILSFWQGK